LLDMLAHRIIRNTIGPPLLIGLLEIPVLVTYFSEVKVGDGFHRASASSSASTLLIVLLGFLSLTVGFLIKDLGRSIQIFILAQVIAFSLSAIPLFISSNTNQLGITQFGQADFPLASVGAFMIGWCILVIIMGTLAVTVGFFIGELSSRRQDAAFEPAATWVLSRRCPKCGARIFSRAKFCPDCGNKLEE
jgi:zinc-ribbon domain